MIYFITDGEYVKIGFTDKDDVQQRLNALQIGNARELKLVGAMQGGREEELLLHRIFGNFRIRGEWFLLTPQITNDSNESNRYLCAECQRDFATVQAKNAHQRFCAGSAPVEPVHTNGVQKSPFG